MLETGNWLVPQFDYGTPFWGKPPLSIWLTAAAMSVFGVNEFAARLPSMVLTIGCGALVYAVAHAAAGRAAALLCAVVFATTGLVFVGAGAVVTDPSLTFGTTLAMAGFWLAANGPPGNRRAWGLAFFAGLAIGLLAKGPIAVVLTALPIGAWVVWQRQWRGLYARLPWITGTLLVAALVVPWYWAAERATPGFLDYFLIGEHWKRFTEPGWTGDRYGVAHAWKRGWIWLFWVAAAVPWSIVALDWLVRVFAAPRDRVRARLADPLFRYVLCWALAPLVFFTASGNVLITYVLPGLPAFALVLGLFGPVASEATRALDRAEKARVRRVLRAGGRARRRAGHAARADRPRVRAAGAGARLRSAARRSPGAAGVRRRRAGVGGVLHAREGRARRQRRGACAVLRRCAPGLLRRARRRPRAVFRRATARGCSRWRRSASSSS